MEKGYYIKGSTWNKNNRETPTVVGKVGTPNKGGLGTPNYFIPTFLGF